MALFSEELLTTQDEYVRANLPGEDKNNDKDLAYSDDDLGENTEITPLGDAIKDDEANNLYKVGPDDDEDFDDEDEDLLEVDDNEDVEDISLQINPDDDDDLLTDDDDDDFLDDDDLDSGVVAPELEDEDLDDDELLSDDDDFDDDDVTPSSSIPTDTDFASRNHGRVTGTMVDHEPGLGGTDKNYNL